MVPPVFLFSVSVSHCSLGPSWTFWAPFIPTVLKPNRSYSTGFEKGCNLSCYQRIVAFNFNPFAILFISVSRWDGLVSLWNDCVRIGSKWKCLLFFLEVQSSCSVAIQCSWIWQSNAWNIKPCCLKCYNLLLCDINC